MSDLLEQILNQDYATANELFESKMLELQEKKLYESKRMMQSEVFGGLSPEEIAARKKSGYKKAADVLGDPRERIKKARAAAAAPSGTKRGSTRPTETPSTAPSEPVATGTRRERMAKAGYKMLSAKSAAANTDKMDRYRKALDKAKDLEARGHSKAVSRVKSAYAGTRAKAAAKGAHTLAGRLVAGILQNVEE